MKCRMIRLERAMATITMFTVLLAAVSAANAADSPSKATQDVPRTSSKPSVWKSWRSEMKIFAQQQMHTAQYIRGSGTAEYDVPVGGVSRR